MCKYLNSLNLQEVFESLNEAASAVLGEAQYKTHNITNQPANSPTAAVTGAKLSGGTTCTSCDGLAEVQSDLKSNSICIHIVSYGLNFFGVTVQSNLHGPLLLFIQSFHLNCWHIHGSGLLVLNGCLIPNFACRFWNQSMG